MKKVSYILLVVLVLILFIGVFAFINQDKLVDRFISRATAATSFRYELLDLDIPIRLVTVGTGSPLPGERVRSCNAVFVNGKFFVFDVGPGASRAIERLRLPLDRLEGIFITHWHADHYMDLPELVNRSWLLNRSTDLHLYGPEPLDSIYAGMSQFLHIENHYRVAHHGADIMDPSLALPITHLITPDHQGYQKVYDVDGVVIEAFTVDHAPVDPALGYRISYQGKSLVISGDTKKSEQVIKYARDADILLHEALAFDLIKRAIDLQKEADNSRSTTILEDILEYHVSPQEAAEVAEAAGAKKLILTHLGPAPENPISRRFYASDLDDIYRGPVLLAEDGDLYIIE